MDKILCIDLHDIVGQFHKTVVDKKLRSLNKGILLPSDKYVKSSVSTVTIINEDIKDIQSKFKLQQDNYWIVRKKCIGDNENIDLHVVFVCEHEYLPEQIYELNVDMVLRGLNFNKKTSDKDYWVACNADYLYYYSQDKSRVLSNLLVKLKEQFYWIVQQSVIKRSKDFNKNKGLMDHLMNSVDEIVVKKFKTM
jgi:hypothetical protein